LVLILDERVIAIPKNKFAQYDRAPTVGERGANPSQPDGSPIDVTITEVTESKVTVDFKVSVEFLRSEIQKQCSVEAVHDSVSRGQHTKGGQFVRNRIILVKLTLYLWSASDDPKTQLRRLSTVFAESGPEDWQAAQPRNFQDAGGGREA
jgi:hypothetical protein